MAQPCDGKRSASSADTNKSEGSQIETIIPRFELDVPTSNAWDLLISMSEYLDKYMHIHIPDKYIRKKIPKYNPVHANVKEPQILDNYIKELLIENKKTLTSTYQKSLKVV